MYDMAKQRGFNIRTPFVFLNVHDPFRSRLAFEKELQVLVPGISC